MSVDVSKDCPQAMCVELWVCMGVLLCRGNDKPVPKGRGVPWQDGGELCKYMWVHVSVTTSM